MLAGSIKNENTFTYILSYCFKSKRNATNPKLGLEPPVPPQIHKALSLWDCSFLPPGLYLPSSLLKGKEVIHININPLETSDNLTIRVFNFFFFSYSHK